MFFKFIYYIYVIFIFNPSVALSLETRPQDLVDNCKTEMSETQFGSGCLTLGIVAQKVNHMDLYNKIEGLCVNHYKFRTSSNDEDLETLLAYYPQCFYVFKHKTLQKELVKFDSEVELKTLVRFLNNSLVK